MTNIPGDRKYTKTHEWARADPASPKGSQAPPACPNVGQGGFAQASAVQAIAVGITDFAQHQLSDITYVELPEVGAHFPAGKEMVVVESIKAAADVYAPISGIIMDVNSNLADNPGVLNTDPHGAGWLVKIKPDNPQDLNKLMPASDYEGLIANKS